MDALEWCLELGITHASMYAFSIENFKRSPEEVATLMFLAEIKLRELLTVRGPRCFFSFFPWVLHNLGLLSLTKEPSCSNPQRIHAIFVILCIFRIYCCV